MKLTRKEFETAVVWNGDVLIEIPDLAANRVKFNGSLIEIVGSTGDDQARQATRFGRIAKMPRKQPDIQTNIFNATLDSREGDECWFDAFYAQEQIAKRNDKARRDLLWDVEGKFYLSVPTSSVVAIKRDGKIMGVCGYVIGEILPEEEISPGGIILIKPKTNYARVKVHHASTAEVRFKEDSRDKFRTTKVKEGDTVLVESHFCIPLDKTYNSETSLVRFQNFTILAYCEN